MKADSERINSMINKIKLIADEVTTIYAFRNGSIIGNEIIKKANIQMPNIFYAWMNAAYASDVLMRVRRLIDNDSNTNSFIILLKDIACYPLSVSLPVFMEKYPKSEQGFASCDYSEITGKPMNADITKDDIERDIFCLLEDYKKVNAYIDKRVAHIDRYKQVKAPSFQDLDQVVNSIEVLVSKYYTLLTGAAIRLNEPTIL